MIKKILKKKTAKLLYIPQEQIVYILTWLYNISVCVQTEKEIPFKIILLIVYVAKLNRSLDGSLCNILTNTTGKHFNSNLDLMFK